MTQKQAIEADARQAALTGLTPNDACPWPFYSLEGRYWVAMYLVTKNRKQEHEYPTSNSVPPCPHVHAQGPDIYQRTDQSLGELQMSRAPYIRMKDYDHEDVEADFDTTLRTLGSVLASIGVFSLLMLAITVLMQFPDMWLSKTLIALWRGL